MEAQNTQNIERILADDLPLDQETVLEQFDRPSGQWGILAVDYYVRVCDMGFRAEEGSPEDELRRFMDSVRHKRIEDEAHEIVAARIRQVVEKRRQEFWGNVRNALGKLSLFGNRDKEV